MTAATFAIAGFPPFAGFFSKDAILWKAFSSPYGSWIYWLIGVFTAFLTSFYMFRLWFLTFFGEYRGEAASHGDGHIQVINSQAGAPAPHGHSGIHESPTIMLVPLVILAVLSICGGWVGSERFDKFLSPALHYGVTAYSAEEAAPATPAPEPKEQGGSESLLHCAFPCLQRLRDYFLRGCCIIAGRSCRRRLRTRWAVFTKPSSTSIT